MRRGQRGFFTLRMLTIPVEFGGLYTSTSRATSPFSKIIPCFSRQRIFSPITLPPRRVLDFVLDLLDDKRVYDDIAILPRFGSPLRVSADTRANRRFHEVLEAMKILIQWRGCSSHVKELDEDASDEKYAAASRHCSSDIEWLDSMRTVRRVQDSYCDGGRRANQYAGRCYP